MFKKYIFIFVLALASFSCNSSSGPSGNEVPNIVLTEPPVVTGIWMSDITGNSLGPWGNPSSSLKGIPVVAKPAGTPTITADTIIEIPVEDTYFRLEPPIPNPAVEIVYFRFTLPIDTRASIFVTRARLAGTIEHTSVGGAVVSGSKKVVVAILRDSFFSAGNNIVSWNSKDSDGNRLPTGFYRVYLVAGSSVLFQDIFIAGSREEFLPGMPGKK